MTRFLVLVALAVLLAYLASRGMARLQEGFRDVMGDSAVRRPQAGRQLVVCSVCGVHVPRARALAAPPTAASGASAPGSAGSGPKQTSAGFFCSEDCRRRASSGPEATRAKSA